MRRVLAISLCLLAATACASTPPRVQRSEFEDIPVPKGLTVDISRSTVIESPAVKAARIFYKGRLEVDSRPGEGTRSRIIGAKPVDWRARRQRRLCDHAAISWGRRP